MKKKLCCQIILLFVFSILIFSRKTYASSSDFSYELDSNNNAIITSYKGTSSQITIPNTIDNYEVKKISDHAFNENRNSTNGKILTNVIISEGITTIGDFAFIGCSNLESITLPETLTSLGDQTFIGCSKLNKINIPSNLKQFRSYVFQETNFTEFIIPEHFESIGSSDFRSCSKLRSFKVYSKEVIYADDVFQNCSDDLILYGYEGSTTQLYAEKNGLKFKVLSDENEKIPVTSITLNKTSLTLHVGDVENLTVSFLPDNASDKIVNWSSSNTNVATVENGKITAKNVGETTIIVSTMDATQKATCNIVVAKKELNAEKKPDNTVANTKLPLTGVRNFVIVLFLVLFIVIFILYKKYKKI